MDRSDLPLEDLLASFHGRRAKPDKVAAALLRERKVAKRNLRKKKPKEEKALPSIAHNHAEPLWEQGFGIKEDEYYRLRRVCATDIKGLQGRQKAHVLPHRDWDEICRDIEREKIKQEKAYQVRLFEMDSPASPPQPKRRKKPKPSPNDVVQLTLPLF